MRHSAGIAARSGGPRHRAPQGGKHIGRVRRVPRGVSQQKLRAFLRDTEQAAHGSLIALAGGRIEARREPRIDLAPIAVQQAEMRAALCLFALRHGLCLHRVKVKSSISAPGSRTLPVDLPPYVESLGRKSRSAVNPINRSPSAW